MGDWVILAFVSFAIYKLDSLTELDVGRGWLRLKFAPHYKRLRETSHTKRSVRKK
jgi:hypothetical protein